MNANTSFIQAIEAAGLAPPVSIIGDGKLHRFSSSGDRAAAAGWYAFFPDTPQAGAFGCWRSGIKQNWCSKSDKQMSAAERTTYKAWIENIQLKREKDARRRLEWHKAAAIRAAAIWDAAAAATADHPYVQRKRVQPHGLRIHSGNLTIAGTNVDGALVVPIYKDGTLSTLEFIAGDGTKRFLDGGEKRGGYFPLGAEAITTSIVIVEGVATGLSVHEATGHPVVCAMDAGNLLPVAMSIRSKYPGVKILVAGDHDLSGTGQRTARKAAEAIGGVACLPETEGQDFNDVHVKMGLDVVKAAITTALRQEEITTMETERILDEVHVFLGRFVAYPSQHARVAHCLWVAHTHLMDKWESTPRLAFLSPEPGSGKTRAMELTETLVPRPVEAINVTSAYVFRKISDPNGLPTILHDEIDTIFGAKAKEHEEIRGVINAGHRRGAAAGRCVVKGKIIETEELPAFCAVAMAGLGNLPDTILSRSVIIKMRRRAPGEQVEPYRRRLHAPEGYALWDRLAVWAHTINATINTFPIMPSGITDRNADVWESLLSVADAVGGPWPERARVAAVALVADARGGQPSLGIRLLGDLRTVFADRDHLPTVDLIIELINLEESPWGDLKGKPLDARRLANLLKPYAILSKQIRVGEVNLRGYTRESLWDAFLRYLPPTEPSVGGPPMVGATSATSATVEPAGLFFEEIVDDDC